MVTAMMSAIRARATGLGMSIRGTAILNTPPATLRSIRTNPQFPNSTLIRTTRQYLSSSSSSVVRSPARLSFLSNQSKAFVLRSHSASTCTSTPITSVFRRLFSRSLRRRNVPSPNPTPHLGSPPVKENLSLSQRLKKLSREYGWSALGVYLLLSALDFPFCYLLVRTLGTDRIGEWEEVIVSNVKKVIPENIKEKWHEWRESMKAAEKEYTGKETVTDGVEMAGWGVEEAEQNHKKEASLGTQLALAYAIHKSFIFVRVPLTAAVTPKIVKVLRGWGWDIGKRTTKAAKAAKRAEVAAVKASKSS